MENNRRKFIKHTAALAACLSIGEISRGSENTFSSAEKFKEKKVVWPVIERADTPKITLNSSANASPANMRLIKQFGVDYVLMGGPQLPWTETRLREIMDRFKAEGLTVINMMLPTISEIIYAKPGRDEQIKNVQDSLVAAGKVGLPVVEYNFYAHRLTEGYYDIVGRGG